MREPPRGPRLDRDRLALIGEIVSAVPATGSRGDFYRRLLDALFRTLDVRRGFLALRDAEEGRLRTVASRDLGADGVEDPEVPVSGTVLEITLEEGEPQRLDDALADPDLGGAESVRRLGIRSVLCAPVPVRGRPEGVLYADNRARASSFTAEDLEFLVLLGRLAGLALEGFDRFETLDRENDRLRAALRDGIEMIATAPAMEPVLRRVRLAAPTDATVLVGGESGCGKELLAVTLHRLSDRSRGPFVPVNCAAIPEALLEAELFGLAPRSGVAGAPPEGRPGKFERAHGGTILLDEIGDMSLSTQARILRVLEERVVERIGGGDPVPVDLRVVAATNKDLEEEVAAGRFREDLLFRLKVVEVRIPPLRERPQDVLPLAEHFLRRFGGDRLRFTAEAREALLAHRWPGNVRELRNAVERAAILCEGRRVGPEHLSPGTAKEPGPRPARTLEEVEREHVARVLAEQAGNVTAAARVLGIARNTLYDRIRRFGLGEPRGPGAPAGE